jgi:LPS export ABC transporter permease LptF/LPS export ABC transporter permease LptG
VLRWLDLASTPRLVRLPSILDRYVVAEILPPSGLGLVLFTFVLLLNHITQLTGVLISRGADLPTILRIFLNLMPSILAITIPMAFLLGVLLAFGRLASDSEIVALRASGVSALELLKPVVLLSLLTSGLTFYVMAVSVPRSNQAFREIVYSLMVSKARSGIKPRVFTDDVLPGLVLYVSDIPVETGLWSDVFIHDGRDPQRPRVILARGGQMVIDKERERVELRLEHGTRYTFSRLEPEVFQEERFSSLEAPLDFATLFPRLAPAKGDREMTLAELGERIARLRAEGRPRRDVAPFQVEWHKKFAIGAACLVFGLLGVSLSLGSRKEARSSAFGLSIGVIFVYYVLIRLGEQAGDMGLMPPWIAMWGANLVLGALGAGLLHLNQRQAAFDPLDPSQYVQWLPRLKRATPAASGAEPAHGPGARRRAVVVLRVPRPSLPSPSLLDRYIGRAYVAHFSLVLVAFLAVFVLAEFMDLFDDIQQHHVKGATVLHYYGFHVPAVAYLVLPVAALVGPLVTFGILTRRNEITAMKAGGLSLYRVVLPVILLGGLQSLALFGAAELLLPYTNRVAERDFNVIKGRPPQTTNVLEKRWILGDDGQIYNYDYLSVGAPEPSAALTTAVNDGRTTTLFGFSAFDVDTSRWELRDRLYADRAHWSPLPAREGTSGYYELERGWRRSFGTKGGFKVFNLARTREIEPPSFFMQEQPSTDTLRYDELRVHIAALKSKGLDVTRLEVQLERKVAFPMVALVMTLIGVPFAFAVGSRGALYGIGLSILIAILYWGTLGIFEALGNNAWLHPMLAAWAPNLLFAVAGLYLMLTLET